MWKIVQELFYSCFHFSHFLICLCGHACISNIHQEVLQYPYLLGHQINQSKNIKNILCQRTGNETLPKTQKSEEHYEI